MPVYFMSSYAYTRGLKLGIGNISVRCSFKSCFVESSTISPYNLLDILSYKFYGTFRDIHGTGFQSSLASQMKERTKKRIGPIRTQFCCNSDNNKPMIEFVLLLLRPKKQMHGK